MRILVAIQSLGPGGTERTLVNTLPSLVERGHECIVCPLGPPYDLEGPLRNHGVEVHRLPARHRWNLLAAANGIADIARGFRADIIHGKLYFAELAAALARTRVRGAGFTVSFHNLAHDYTHVPRYKRDLRRGIEAGFLHLGIHSFSAISRAVAEHFERHLRIGPVEVIHNPVPADTLVERAEQTATPTDVDALDGDEPWLLVPARLSLEKGHRYLIEALELLEREDGLRPRAAFYGPGPLEGALRSQPERAGLTRRIHVSGQSLSHDACLAAMQNASAVVLPSTYEAFGLAAAEAMSVGTPVIASAVGGYLDVIEDGVSGRLVPVADSRALAATLRTVLTDREHASQLELGGPERVRSQFSISHIVGLWEDFYARTRIG